MPVRPLHPRALITAVGAVVALVWSVLPVPVGAAASPSTSAAASTAPVVSSSHPYSDPIWYPIRDEVYLDCVRGNPGCPGFHTSWTMDMVAETGFSDPGVYAMGAGRFHIGDANGAACKDGATANFGTWAWIDHGGGSVSRYGHFSKLLVKEGALVQAGQEIGLMGTTGKNENCTVPYLDFQLRNHGVSGPTVEMSTLQVCYQGTEQTWPGALVPADNWRTSPIFAQPSSSTRYAVWNDVPKRSMDFPASSGDCIPQSLPQTAATPGPVRVSRAGSGALTVSWAQAPTTDVTSVQIELSEYHTSTKTWDYPQNEYRRWLAPTTTSRTVSGLLNGRDYRARISLHGPGGWTEADSWQVLAPAGPPATPGFRSVSVTQPATSASIHFLWSKSAENGLPVTGYQAEIRRSSSGGSSWSSHTVSSGTYHYYWPGQRKHATYDVRVRALYDGGATAFLTKAVST